MVRTFDPSEMKSELVDVGTQRSRTPTPQRQVPIQPQLNPWKPFMIGTGIGLGLAAYGYPKLRSYFYPAVQVRPNLTRNFDG